jgi:hypothetical protein
MATSRPGCSAISWRSPRCSIFAGAAERLALTPQIQKLESQLGAKLLERCGIRMIDSSSRRIAAIRRSLAASEGGSLGPGNENELPGFRMMPSN